MSLRLATLMYGGVYLPVVVLSPSWPLMFHPRHLRPLATGNQKAPVCL